MGKITTWFTYWEKPDVYRVCLYPTWKYCPFQKDKFYLFSLLIEEISISQEEGSVIINGNFNSRIGISQDLLENDLLILFI